MLDTKYFFSLTNNALTKPLNESSLSQKIGAKTICKWRVTNLLVMATFIGSVTNLLVVATAKLIFF